MTPVPSSTPLVAPGASINEDVFYEGGPARGDLLLNLLFGLTLIGIPFAVGAIVRALWLRFTITSRRVSVSGGWLGRDRTQVVYSQIREVRSVPRGFGFWGDMVLVLSDGMKLEMRAVPRYREAEAFILERMDAAAKTAGSAPKSGFGAAA
ncbi:PH domain-containing protein [Vulcanococcus limneticus Candia 3F8]|uniref:PH domain-containing protein n=1 Tax=Vulcanococcus limneticus TaxID=2170428 RepID=UPI000B99CF23|nr:PH domain-containing protein [Vulcanococcus limneticus]MCP9790850.1 PH domain-containing protein [Vulcanococcus limneticus MW73D5]MCP9892807.1 PH domain-containing protein [Vulcanococcus limneticus Candia 3F8]MCP9896457.1 PH domain-containing protein [Vulcanococcus limneticus Candia 3B3]